MRAIRGYGSITENGGDRLGDVALLPDVVQPPVQERHLVRLQRHDRPVQLGQRGVAATAQCGRDGQRPLGSGAAEQLLGNNNPQSHDSEGELRLGSAEFTAASAAWRAVGLVVNDWQLSGIWTGATAGGVHGRLQLPERRRRA